MAALAGGLYLAILAIALVLFGIVWLMRSVARPRSAQAWVRDAAGDVVPFAVPFVGPAIEEVRLMPGHDAVPEGLGVLARRPSPHATEPRNLTPLAYLPEDQWQLWTTVLKESAR